MKKLIQIVKDKIGIPLSGGLRRNKKKTPKKTPPRENHKQRAQDIKLKSRLQLTRKAVRHTSPQRRFSTNPLTAGEMCCHQGPHICRRLRKEGEPVAEGLHRPASETKGATGREHATDDPGLQRDLLHATRGVAGDAHAISSEEKKSVKMLLQIR